MDLHRCHVVLPNEALVSALYHREGKTFVRAYEYRGAGGKMSVEVTRGRPRLTEVDLRGHDLGASAPAFPIQPWEIKTVRLERSIE
jgi:hypothetical protein